MCCADEYVVFRGVSIRREVVQLLMLIKRYGSLNKAARIMGMPYATAYRLIKDAENLLLEPLIESVRGGVGGGSTRLTRVGEELLFASNMESVVMASSHDKLLSYVIEDTPAIWVGSLNGLVMVASGKAKVAGIHLTSIYPSNLKALDELGLLGRLAVIRGYRRIIGIGYRDGLGIRGVKDLVELVRRGRIRLIRRNIGSGTRIFCERWLRSVGISNPASVPVDAWTHDDVAKAIALGKADYGFMTQYTAYEWGLEFIPLAVEDYDIVVRRDSLGEVAQVIKSIRKLRGVKVHGYIIPNDVGEVVSANQGA